MSHSMETAGRDASLWSRGMVAVLVAQFLSAMADNALLFGALALLKLDHEAASSTGAKRSGENHSIGTGDGAPECHAATSSPVAGESVFSV